MATFNVTTSNQYISGYVEYTETFGSDYITTNKSTLTATLYLRRTNIYSGTPTSSTSCVLTFKIDGTTYTQNVGTITIPNGGAYVNIGSASKEITHNADGSYKTSISVTYSMPYSNLTLSEQSSGTIYLTTIPRASTILCNSPYIGDVATISIDKKSSTFTNTLTYEIGTLTGTIATKTSEAIVQFETDKIEDSIYSLIPNDKEIQGTIYCTTYSGDTQVGETQLTTFNLYAKESECKPTISATVVDTNEEVTTITGSNTKFVKYLSKPKVTIIATPKNSASIKSCSIDLNDGQTSNLQENTFDTIASNKVTVSVIDSRTYPNYKDYDLDMIDYIQLHINKIELTRPESTANELILNLEGVFYNGSFTDEVSNSLEASFKYRLSGTDEWTSGGNITLTTENNTFKVTNLSLGEVFNYNEEYQFELTIEDKLMKVTRKEPIPKGEEVWWESEDGIGVNGYIWLNGQDLKKAINKLIEKESLFAGSSTRVSSIGDWADTMLNKNPLDYDILFVTVENSGSEGESVVVPMVKQNNEYKMVSAVLYVYSTYNASFRILATTNKISLQVREITGWSISNLCITNVDGIKLTKIT